MCMSMWGWVCVWTNAHLCAHIQRWESGSLLVSFLCNGHLFCNCHYLPLHFVLYKTPYGTHNEHIQFFLLSQLCHFLFVILSSSLIIVTPLGGGGGLERELERKANRIWHNCERGKIVYAHYVSHKGFFIVQNVTVNNDCYIRMRQVGTHSLTFVHVHTNVH